MKYISFNNFEGCILLCFLSIFIKYILGRNNDDIRWDMDTDSSNQGICSSIHYTDGLWLCDAELLHIPQLKNGVVSRSSCNGLFFLSMNTFNLKSW